MRSPVDVFFETWLSLRYDLGHVWVQPDNIRIADMQHGVGATIAVDTPVGPVAISVGRRFYFLDNPPRVALGPYMAYFGVGLRL
jgi:outer membrane translocation and assembly module TamA